MSLKADNIHHDPETELTRNLAHNVQMDVSVFSVIFNDFCSVLCYCTLLRGVLFWDTVYMYVCVCVFESLFRESSVVILCTVSMCDAMALALP